MVDEEAKLRHYQQMQDHDILVGMAVSQDNMEGQLTEMNGSIKELTVVKEEHNTRITQIETTCFERSKTVFRRLDSMDAEMDDNRGVFLVRLSKKQVGAMGGILTAIGTAVYFVGKALRWWP